MEGTKQAETWGLLLQSTKVIANANLHTALMHVNERMTDIKINPFSLYGILIAQKYNLLSLAELQLAEYKKLLQRPQAWL